MNVPFPRPGIRTRAYRSRELAERMAGHLECDTCRRREECDPDRVAEYVRTTWPRCCGGQVMRLVPREGANASEH